MLGGIGGGRRRGLRSDFGFGDVDPWNLEVNL